MNKTFILIIFSASILCTGECMFFFFCCFYCTGVLDKCIRCFYRILKNTKSFVGQWNMAFSSSTFRFQYKPMCMPSIKLRVLFDQYIICCPNTLLLMLWSIRILATAVVALRSACVVQKQSWFVLWRQINQMWELHWNIALYISIYVYALSTYTCALFFKTFFAYQLSSPVQKCYFLPCLLCSSFICYPHSLVNWNVRDVFSFYMNALLKLEAHSLPFMGCILFSPVLRFAGISLLRWTRSLAVKGSVSR